MNTDTPTPRTDEWETYCDECYYHMWRVRRKNERKFDDGFHVQNGEGARQLVELLNKQDEELTAARELVKNLEITVLSLMMENKTVTEQRDRLAVALQKLRNNESMSLGGAAYEIVEQALQSLITNAQAMASADENTPPKESTL